MAEDLALLPELFRCLPLGTRALRASSLLAGVDPAVPTLMMLGDLDFAWLSGNRPLLKGRRIIFWGTEEEASYFAHQAPHVFDWLSTREDVPPGLPSYAVRTLDALLAGGGMLVVDRALEQRTRAYILRTIPIEDVVDPPFKSLLEACRPGRVVWVPALRLGSSLERRGQRSLLRQRFWAHALKPNSLVVWTEGGKVPPGSVRLEAPAWGISDPPEDALAAFLEPGVRGWLPERIARTQTDPGLLMKAPFLTKHFPFVGLVARRLSSRERLRRGCSPSWPIVPDDPLWASHGVAALLDGDRELASRVVFAAGEPQIVQVLETDHHIGTMGGYASWELGIHDEEWPSLYHPLQETLSVDSTFRDVLRYARGLLDHGRVTSGEDVRSAAYNARCVLGAEAPLAVALSCMVRRLQESSLLLTERSSKEDELRSGTTLWARLEVLLLATPSPSSMASMLEELPFRAWRSKALLHVRLATDVTEGATAQIWLDRAFALMNERGASPAERAVVEEAQASIWLHQGRRKEVIDLTERLIRFWRAFDPDYPCGRLLSLLSFAAVIQQHEEG